MEIPVIETERLILRAPRLSDFDAYVATRRSPEVYSLFGDAPPAAEDCWRRFITIQGHWALMGFGYWLVEERGTGGYVGEVGMADFRRVIEPSIEGTMEAGWILSPLVHGKGYATEAAQAAIAWGRAQFPGRGITCIISPGNATSLAVAHKCGFVTRCVTDYHGEPVLLLDWKGA